MEFPETTCLVGLAAGRTSTFTRVTRDSLECLAFWLVEALRDSEPIYQSSREAESEFSNSLANTYELQSRISERLHERISDLEDIPLHAATGEPTGPAKKPKSKGVDNRADKSA